LAERIGAAKRPGDVAVASVHWGGNWGYGIEPEQRAAARTLVDGGADVVHGHSSHHPRPMEAYRGRLVLYGCGDLINDYEGIPGGEDYRGDLRLLYLVSLDPGTGAFTGLRMVPLRARRMRLERAGTADARWLQETLDRISRGLGVRVRREPGDAMAASPAAQA
ncbi:CapA family protein, partial [Streptomonospora algeriensis]